MWLNRVGLTSGKVRGRGGCPPQETHSQPEMDTPAHSTLSETGILFRIVYTYYSCMTVQVPKMFVRDLLC